MEEFSKYIATNMSKDLSIEEINEDISILKNKLKNIKGTPCKKSYAVGLTEYSYSKAEEYINYNIIHLEA